MPPGAKWRALAGVAKRTGGAGAKALVGQNLAGGVLERAPVAVTMIPAPGKNYSSSTRCSLLDQGLGSPRAAADVLNLHAPG
jgi:hypothetical protein